MVLCLCPAHSIRRSFTNIIPRWEPVGDIRCFYDSGSEDEYGPKFIHCVDRIQPEIHEVWTFGEDGVTTKVHPTARVDVGTFVGDCFATNFLTLTWHSIPMLDSNYINGSVKWLVVPNFLMNNGPPWTLNLLAPYANWGDRGSSTSPNLGIGSGGYSDGVSVNWNCPACVLPI